MSGPKLGRPTKEHKADPVEKRDNKSRIEVERFFSLEKRCNGAGLIMTRLGHTSLAAIALSVWVTNMFVALKGLFLCSILWSAVKKSRKSILLCSMKEKI